MSVGKIDRLLKALGEGWVELLGRPTDRPDVIGYVLENNNNKRRCVEVGPVPPGGFVPPSKTRNQSADDLGGLDGPDNATLNNPQGSTAKGSGFQKSQCHYRTKNSAAQSPKKKKKAVIVPSEESEAEKTPVELSKSKDTLTESLSEDANFHEDSNAQICDQEALRQPEASDDRLGASRPSTPASDASLDISLNALKRHQRNQSKRVRRNNTTQ
ncbi:hypothetical protein PCASD_12069 [Puccinia coronata f. sp. avenae]|uniref:Uncharacterized protein n=1 Tax=Puccinia coronata f. sp. avenae TaxID=200324 RepID=A0A2N5RZ19_9BASI|nr:hypothetical protein PCASD_26493 [Puccinia coronata f. sp. avenae]PLW36250.1 hypothetical protein PCASD_12069 [Puccinia coronata f. sp. avenae]